MITVITMNPYIEEHIAVETFETNKLLLMDDIHLRLGSSGFKIAQILSRFSVPTMNLTFLGKDNLAEVLEFFRKGAMAIDYIEVAGHTKKVVKIKEKTTNSNWWMTERGFHIDKDLYSAFLDKIDRLSKNSSLIVLSGEGAEGVLAHTYRNIINLYKRDSKVIVIAEGSLLKESLIAEPYMIVLNEQSLEELTQVSCETISEAIKQIHKIIKEYDISNVIYYSQNEGFCWVADEVAYYAQIEEKMASVEMSMIDAFFSGIIYGINREREANISLSYGIACFKIALDQGQIIDLDDMFDRARQVMIKEIKLIE